MRGVHCDPPSQTSLMMRAGFESFDAFIIQSARSSLVDGGFPCEDLENELHTSTWAISYFLALFCTVYPYRFNHNYFRLNVLWHNATACSIFCNTSGHCWHICRPVHSPPCSYSCRPICLVQRCCRVGPSERTSSFCARCHFRLCARLSCFVIAKFSAAGVSSGIGQSCVKLLSRWAAFFLSEYLLQFFSKSENLLEFFPSNGRYACVDIVTMGRSNSSQPARCDQSIAVDFAHPDQVAAAAKTLVDLWFGVSKSSASQCPGHDIVINNAGVFTGCDSGTF